MDGWDVLLAAIGIGGLLLLGVSVALIRQAWRPSRWGEDER